MSIEFNIKKRRHFYALSDFEKKAQEAYFETETDIDMLDESSALPALFFRLTSLITDYQKADEKHKKIFENQIETLTAGTPEIRNCYKQINGKKYDLATIAVEMNTPKWAVYMINGEHTANRIAREKFNERESRYGERDIFDEDDEPKFQKTEKQKDLLFLMYAGKARTFLPTDEMITMFTQELDISPHKIVSIKSDEKTQLKTTPFMYFLQNNYYSDIEPSVVKSVKNPFYYGADFSFQNFEGDTLSDAFLNANLYSLFGDYYMHKQQEEQKTPRMQAVPEVQPQEEDLFSVMEKKTAQKKYSENLFDFSADKQNETTNTQPVKPISISSHKKGDETPNLPGFDFQKD